MKKIILLLIIIIILIIFYSNMNVFEGIGVNTPQANNLNSTQTLGTNVSKTVIGTSINLTATSVNTLFGANSTLQTTVTVIGRDSGARLTIPVTITKTN